MARAKETVEDKKLCCDLGMGQRIPLPPPQQNVFYLHTGYPAPPVLWAVGEVLILLEEKRGPVATPQGAGGGTELPTGQ